MMQGQAYVWQPLSLLALLMGSAFFIWLLGEKRQTVASVWAVVSLIAGGMIAATMGQQIMAGQILSVTYNILPPFGLTFRIDLLSFALLMLFLAVGTVVVLYTATFPLGERTKTFRAIFLFVLASAMGVVMAGDLLSFFLFFEAMSLCFFILVIHNRTKEAVAATYKFLYMAIGGSVLYFIALAAVFNQAGRLDWQDGGFLGPGSYTGLAFLGFLIAFGIKSGLFPLHLWMADAYSQAPAPAVTLSSMIMLKTGAYGLIRVMHHVFGIELVTQAQWHYPIIILSGITILYGSICAFAEKDLMRRLAYSGMAQLSYILLGIALITPESFTGSIYHVMAHAAMKGTLLLCAGLLVMRTGTGEISELKGIGRQMPLTMSCFALASLTAVGLPPMNIFISKWYLSLGALAADAPLLILLLLISSMLNAAYYLPIVILAFFGEENRDLQASLRWDRIPWAMTVSTVMLTVACFAFSVFPVNPALRWAQNITGVFFR